MNEPELTTAERESALVAGNLAMIRMAIAQGHDVYDLLGLYEGEAHTDMATACERAGLLAG